MAVFAETLDGMKARIAFEIRRADLTDAISQAIADAIKHYQKERFRFSDIIPTTPPVFNTVVDRAVYTSADNANISTLYSFDYVFLNIGNTITYLEYDTPMNIKLTNQVSTMKGQPQWYGYEGDELILGPIPNDVWQVTLGVFRRVAAPATGDEAGNKWMTDAEMLIRSRAKFEIYSQILRNEAQAMAMSPDPPMLNNGKMGATYRAWKALKGEANRVTGGGRVRPMAF